MRERRAEAAHHLVLRQTAGRLASNTRLNFDTLLIPHAPPQWAHSGPTHCPAHKTSLQLNFTELTGDVFHVQTTRSIRRCSGRSYATRLIGPPLHSENSCSTRIYKNGFYFKNVQKKLQKARCSGAKRAFRELGPLKSVFFMTQALGTNHTLFFWFQPHKKTLHSHLTPLFPNITMTR